MLVLLLCFFLQLGFPKDVFTFGYHAGVDLSDCPSCGCGGCGCGCGSTRRLRAAEQPSCNEICNVDLSWGIWWSNECIIACLCLKNGGHGGHWIHVAAEFIVIFRLSYDVNDFWRIPNFETPIKGLLVFEEKKVECWIGARHLQKWCRCSFTAYDLILAFACNFSCFLRQFWDTPNLTWHGPWGFGRLRCSGIPMCLVCVTWSCICLLLYPKVARCKASRCLDLSEGIPGFGVASNFWSHIVPTS